MKKTILLVVDDPKVETALKEALGEEYGLETVKNSRAAAERLQEKMPDLMVIDFDLKSEDGLQVFRQLHPLAPRVKVIMLSLSNNVSLAVSATKLGVSDFLKKPVTAQQLRSSVEKNLAREEEVFFRSAEIEWLKGDSDALEIFYANLQKALAAARNLLLVAGPGIEKAEVVEFIHARSLKRNRKLIKLDLSSFRRDDLEPHFWTTVQETLAEPQVGSLQNEEDRCGTLYLDHIEALDGNFRQSIFEFLKERKGKIDKEALAIIGIRDRGVFPEGYARVEIPPLRERKQDLPYLLSYYLKSYSVRHNKKVKAVAADLLDLLAAYDYPGNYEELECMMEQGVLLAASEVLELKDIPLDRGQIEEVSTRKTFRSGRLGFEEARRGFEKDLYRVLLAKTSGDIAASARFLDVPRTVLAERLENLGHHLPD